MATDESAKKLVERRMEPGMQLMRRTQSVSGELCSGLIIYRACLPLFRPFLWGDVIGRDGLWRPSIASSFASSDFAHRNSASFQRTCFASRSTPLTSAPGASLKFGNHFISKLCN
jgi:hypothetical protein